MFLLKKIVGGLSGKTSDDTDIARTHERSRSETPTDQVKTNNNENEDNEVVKVTKKKRGRSSRSMKRKKTEKKVVHEDHEEPTEDSIEDNVVHREDSSPSQEALSDLNSEKIREEISDHTVIDGKSEKNDDDEEDGTTEAVNFDDFWADFDEIEGKPRKSIDNSLTVIQDNTAAVDTLPEQLSPPAKELNNLNNNSNVEHELTAEEKTSSIPFSNDEPDDCTNKVVDFWAEEEEDTVPLKVAQEESDVQKNDSNNISDENIVSPLLASNNSDFNDSQLQNKEDSPEVVDFWADRDNDFPLEKEHKDAVNLPINTADSVRSNSSKDNSRENSEPLEHSKSSNCSEENSNSLNTSTYVDSEEFTVAKSEADTWLTGLTGTNSEVVDGKQLLQLQSDNSSDSDISKSESANGTEAEMLASDKAESSSVDLETSIPGETSPVKDVKRGCEVEESSGDNFWGDTNDDMPPVFEVKKSMSSDALVFVGGSRNDEKLDWAINNEASPTRDVGPGCEVEETSVDNFWGAANDDIPPVFEVKKSMSSDSLAFEGGSPSDEKLDGVVNNEASPTRDVEPGREVEEPSVDNFWGDANDDVPPVFEVKKPILSDSLLFDDSLTEEQKLNESVKDEEDLSSTKEESDTASSEVTPTNTKEDSVQNGEEASETASSQVAPSNTEENSIIKDEEEEETSSQVEQKSTEEICVRKEEDRTDDIKYVKEDHKRNFAKALRDIEAPSRRRSVVPSDNRERVIQDERVRQLSETSSGRHRQVSESSVDDVSGDDDGIMDYLGKENKSAEARLAARRQARVEAREIRMRELERVQKEQEENSDKVVDLYGSSRQNAMSSVSPRERPTSTNSYHSSRRSSEDSMEDGLSLRDIRHELKEVEEKFRKAMIANAQLDNEKAALTYQVELLKDRLEELEETHSQLGREHRERCREHEALKRAAMKLKEDLNTCKQCLDERDRLIAGYGLVIVGGEIDDKGEVTPRTLISAQSAEFLETAGEGSLDVRLKALAKEKNELVDEVRHFKLELEEERNRRRNDKMLSNGPTGDELQQTLNDYRFRLQKAEQDTSTLQATVARLESQVARYKSAAETSEKAEDELKVEKRKLQREHRESIARIEELETANSHLQRRMDKLKNAKSTLLKEL